MTHVELTGKKRYRTSLLGKLVLQVEEQYTQISTAPPPPQRPGASSDPAAWNQFLLKHATRWTAWRDAIADDLRHIS